jgi:hypothetical protein
MIGKAMIEIKRWDTGAVIYTSDETEIAYALTEAVRQGAVLTDADLTGAVLTGAVLRAAVLRGADLTDAVLTDADLTGAVLRGADLTDADLTGAVLRGAVLRGAVLAGADLRGADLRGADLRGADLRGADLRGADLTDAVLTGAVLAGADLRGAVLTDADLTGAVLTDADLTPIRDDVWSILDAAPAEVPALLEALRAGRFDGSHYEGECACLVGTLANARKCDYESIPGLEPDSNRPAERWALAIRKGHTPDNNPVAAITAKWVEEWMAKREATP